ncbi:hypothetical protein QTP86_007116 [Hemibagrus guttatus]|nr:hypothetical protein QTP86_007116 [Hemibagrus guttatus]
MKHKIWITDFLTDRRQFVRLGTHVSDLQHISTGSPQGCVLSPLLFSLYTNGCTAGHQSVKLLKFADDTTLIGLISHGDELAYRGEMDRLVSWCSMNNLELNSVKTVEMIVDFRKDPAPLPPVILCDSPVTSVESFRFLGTTITKELKWEQNIRSLTKKAQQRMHFLWQLKKFLLPVKMLVNFYTAIIESILTSSITVWFAAATARDKAKLQRVIHSAEKVIGCSLPSLQELYVSRSRRHAAKITANPSHPGNELFRSLPSGKRLRSMRTRTSRHKNSFFPTAVSLLNITYRLGSKNGKANALSRQLEFKSPPPHPDPILPSSIILAPIQWNLMEEIRGAHVEEAPPASCPPAKLYVPSLLHFRVLQWIHESPNNGHRDSSHDPMDSTSEDSFALIAVVSNTAGVSSSPGPSMPRTPSRIPPMGSHPSSASWAISLHCFSGLGNPLTSLPWSRHSQEDALHDTDWNMFRRISDDINVFIEAVMGFIGKLADVTVQKTIIRTFPNQKPWVDKTIRDAPRSRAAAYNAGLASGDMDSYKAASYNVRKMVKEVKQRYGRKLESQLQ